MSAGSQTHLPARTALWAGLSMGTFGVVMALALSEAVNTVTTMILMIIPAGLFFRAMREASRGPACASSGEAQRRYIKRVFFFSSLYLVVLALQGSLLKSSDPSMAVRAGLSVLPGLAILGIFWAIGRLIVEEKDEFIRMLIVRQTLIATGFALGFATIWGFLEAGEVVPHIPAYWFAVAFFGGQFIGAVSNRITHGTWGSL